MKKRLTLLLVVLSLFAGFVGGVGAADGLETITATLNYNVKFRINDSNWIPKNADGDYAPPITYKGTTYIPVRLVAEALNIPINWDGATSTVLINSSPTLASTETSIQIETPDNKKLKSAKEIESYLLKNYAGKSPLKTPLGELSFSFRVTENTSKFNPYDVLIEFLYDHEKFDSLIWNAKNSIRKNDLDNAATTEIILRDFIQLYAKDISSRVENLKLRGETDASFYRYPNIEVDLIVSYKNVWVNYGFVDPSSVFASHESPLVEYYDTVITEFQWVGDYSY